MKTESRKSASIRRNVELAILVFGLVVAVAGCGSSALATGTSGDPGQRSGVKSSATCKKWANGQSSYNPKDTVPKGQPILAGPVVVGCGKGLDEPIRFIAYVQATLHGGEQLCYVLEQPRQKAVTGGSCLQTAPSVALCREGCPLTVEATVARSEGKQGPKGSLVTGAAPGVMEEVVLSSAPLGNKKVTPPLIVVLDGAVQHELQLPSVISLFASVVTPCLPAGQVVYAQGDISGEEFAMQGSDPFGCRA